MAVLAASLTAAAQQSTPATQSSQTGQTGQVSNLPPPATMDQVVDRAILREKDLIKFLSPRTPIVETYLQNLAQDPSWGRFRRTITTSSAAWI